MPTNRDQYHLFESLFREHYEALSNYAFSILRSKEEAEDIVQDVFIKMWKNTPQVIETPQVKFYLLTAVKNNCISFLRKQAGKKFVQPENIQLSVDEEDEETGGDPAVLVSEALSLLPIQCGIIFKMSRFGKLTYQEIASELGLSVKTVENQIGKALRIMREYARQHNISFFLPFIFISWLAFFDLII